MHGCGGVHDVTHVSASAEMYNTPGKCANLETTEVNELAYAMKHAPLLSHKYTAADVMCVTCGSEGKVCPNS